MPEHPTTFNEGIESLKDFRKVTRYCKGSRDVGELLFTALLQGLSIKARIIVSL
ncbi:hypothetical protein BKA58DRAFT_387258 [Alternaria rosae]|uniref:uncharacterized protein n=1 Tax=Alternaria rosae TaxID=1187941 RepID=UPI001E8E2B40|nr:uncharacterized protein BKA58DRAFT_387258 [Alternaria rosae]KAH6868628.1 hypothetical protein BKA58DRAFT_387258 [Alternaria rosae]